MTARIIPFPERIMPHSPRSKPAVVVVLPVIRIERAPVPPPEPEFVFVDFSMVDGSLSRGLIDE